ncbi:putative Romo1 family protein [Cryptosporidium hominis]|nr:putative Romo1 family protein [Cryptosporidium hominis]
MGVKTGAIIGSIFGGINGAYHALKYKNYMAIPVFAIGGAISFGFFLGCGMIVRCQPSELTKYKFHNKCSQVIFPIYFNKIERVSRKDFKIHDNLNNLYKFQNDKISK